MFLPNATGKLRRQLSRDVHGRTTFSAPVELPFAPVSLAVSARKTSVRADSSASRGSADEMVVDQGKILVVTYVSLKIGDRFQFGDFSYVIISKHPRMGVTGKLDHYECDLELLAE